MQIFPKPVFHLDVPIDDQQSERAEKIRMIAKQFREWERGPDGVLFAICQFTGAHANPAAIYAYEGEGAEFLHKAMHRFGVGFGRDRRNSDELLADAGDVIIKLLARQKQLEEQLALAMASKPVESKTKGRL